MKIAIDAYHTLFSAGGIARYARSLISAMAQLATHDEIVLFTNRFRESGKTWRPGIGIRKNRQFYCPRRLLQKTWNTFDWPPIELFCGSVNLFHGLHFVLPPVRKARRVLTVHDLTYLKYPQYFTDCHLNDYGYRKELPQGLARADAIIAVSQKTRDDLVELLKIPGEKITVIYEGVEPRFFKPADAKAVAAIRENYHLAHPYLVFLVGTPEPRKNLLNTVAAVRRAAPDLTLVLIGPRKPLRALVGGNFDHIVFSGIVTEAHLPALLSGAHISLYPSLYEGFGLPVLESMACGVPVITSNQGSLPEIAGGAGILVNPHDVDSIASAVGELLKNRALRIQLMTAGKKRAAEFTWQATARQTLSLYRELV